ncbi:hypothetical protein MMC13_001388 [Lambiella insularis]|nr:hypothetical protein [Lambiella insularis]
MAPATSVPSFDDIIQADRLRRKHEALANEIFSRGRKPNSPALNSKRKPGTGPSLASRVGVAKASQRSASSASGSGVGRDKSRTHGLQQGNNTQSARDSNPRAMSKNSQTYNSSSANQESNSPAVNTFAQHGGRGMTIRGLAGPYVVIASNFAPGTTSADIQSAMVSSECDMQSCKIITSSPTVMAEMVFLDKGVAEKVIATFNNQKVCARFCCIDKPQLTDLQADGRILYVYMKQGPPTPAPAVTPAAPTPLPPIPPEPKAPREPRAFPLDNTHTDPFRSSTVGERNGRRAEPEFQDGRYGFEARDDTMDVDMEDRQEARRDDRRNERNDGGRGRYSGRGRDDRGLYSDDYYSRPRGRGFRQYS